MSAGGGQHDVFRILSLRGPAEDLATDAVGDIDLEALRAAARERWARAILVPPERQTPSRDPRRAKLEAARAAFTSASATLEALETIESKVYRTLAAGGYNRDKLDAKFYTALRARLSDAELAVFTDCVGNEPDRFPPSVGDLSDVFDTQPTVRKGNNLCSQIHVFEEDLKTRLPTARAPEGSSAQQSKRWAGAIW